MTQNVTEECGIAGAEVSYVCVAGTRNPAYLHVRRLNSAMLFRQQSSGLRSNRVGQLSYAWLKRSAMPSLQLSGLDAHKDINIWQCFQIVDSSSSKSRPSSQSEYSTCSSCYSLKLHAAVEAAWWRHSSAWGQKLPIICKQNVQPAEWNPDVLLLFQFEASACSDPPCGKEKIWFLWEASLGANNTNPMYCIGNNS